MEDLTEYILEIFRGDPDGFFNAANEIQQLDKDVIIEALYTLAISHGVDDALLNYGTFLSDKPERRGEAISLFKRAQKQGDKLAPIALAQAYLDDQNPLDALSCLQHVPNDRRSFMLRAEAHRLLGQEERAVEALIEGKDLDVSAAVELIQTTPVLSSTQAIKLLEQHLSEGGSDALLPLADLYAQAGNFTGAIRLLEQAVELGEPNALHDLGKTLIDAGRREEGTQLLRKAADNGDELSQTVLSRISNS